jgi:hypothetical protein
MSELIDELLADTAKIYQAVINHPQLRTMEDCSSILNPLEDLERRLHREKMGCQA